MNIIVVASVAIHALSLTACLLLLRRLRDWRIGALAALIGLLAFTQTAGLVGAEAFWPMSVDANSGALFGLLIAAMGLLWALHVRSMSIEQDATLRRAIAGEQRFQDLFEGAVEGMYRTDPAGRFVEANPALARLFGYERGEDLLGLRATEIRVNFIEPEDFDEMVPRLFEEGAINGFEYRARRRDGTTLWLSESARALFDDQGGYGGMVGFVQDVTKRRAAEAALRRSEAELRAVMENAPAEIYLKDKEGRFVTINRTYERLWGVTDEEVRGKLTAEVHDQAIFAEEARAHDLAVLETGQTVVREQEVRMPDGRHTLRMIKFPICDDDGAVTGLGAIGTDVTRQKAAEHAILQAKEEAELANRTKAEFLATMSHELRTPLNAIIGFSDLIKNEAYGAHGDRRYGEFAGDIFDAGQHLLELINDILDLSKIEAQGSELLEEEIDVADLLGTVQRMLADRAQREGLEFGLVRQGALPNLRCDRRKLKQVLINLVVNAIKFTEAGGRVQLHAWCRKQSGCVFQVIDTGIGIPLEDIPKALSQFGQVDSHLSRRQEGTGLGLPLAKALVELHGGSFDLQSKIGVGTTVTVRIPAERVITKAGAAGQLSA